jgi:hypothetical protein
MSDESDLAVSAGPETVSPPEVTEAPQGTPEGPTDGQAAADTPEGEEAEKSEAAKRREREKAHKERLRKEADEAKALADKADQRRLKIIEAGKNEKPPVESEFSDYAEYVAAKAVWTAEQRTTQRQAEAMAEEAETHRKQAEQYQQIQQDLVERQWAAQKAEAIAKYADFEAIAFTAPISDAVAGLIKQSERGADVAYHLGQNRALAMEISQLPLIEAARIIGRLEVSLTAPTPRMTSQTPEPIAPVRGRAQASLNPEKMSMEEYIAARKARKI